MSGIRLIVGLGNPDAQYEGTRHNAGAFFVRQLANRFNISLSQDKNAVGEIGRGLVAGRDLRLLIPSTYMNHSGRSVAGTARYYRIDPSDMLVAHDELDIEPGEARFKRAPSTRTRLQKASEGERSLLGASPTHMRWRRGMISTRMLIFDPLLNGRGEYKFK